MTNDDEDGDQRERGRAFSIAATTVRLNFVFAARFHPAELPSRRARAQVWT
jgi:hypothetical protein